ncbi:peptidyl-prolyl cis-trans isomerase [bacterium]|nr:peptidyl-prolyl cis-trans isomerase [bacterium]
MYKSVALLRHIQYESIIMKLKNINIFAMIVCLAFCLCNCKKMDSGSVIATVNGKSISIEDYLVDLKLELQKYSESSFTDEVQKNEFKKRVIDQFIERKIFLKEANELGISVSSEEAQFEIQKAKTNYTEESFQKMLQLKSITYQDWKERKIFKLILKKLAQHVVENNIKITEEELRKYYNSNPKEFFQPERLQARQIVTNSEEKANILRKRILRKESFEVIAEQNSLSPDSKKGGDLGIFQRGVYPPVFDEICFSLAPGVLSPVIKSDYGYHLFKVIKKYPAKQLAFDEAHDKIFTKSYQDKSEKIFDEWKADVLGNAKVEINLNLLERIPLPYAND